jgi:hypothetical protein
MLEQSVRVQPHHLPYNSNSPHNFYHIQVSGCPPKAIQLWSKSHHFGKAYDQGLSFEANAHRQGPMIIRKTQKILEHLRGLEAFQKG